MSRRPIALLVALPPLLVAAGPATTQRAPSTNHAEPQFRVEAAADVLAAIEEREMREELDKDWLVEHKSRWAKRLMLAQFDVATNQAEREKAADQYLRRMLYLAQTIWSQRGPKPSRFTLAAANHNITEAKEILACVRTGKPLPSSCD